MATIHYKYPEFPGARCENNCSLCSGECMRRLGKYTLYKAICKSLSVRKYYFYTVGELLIREDAYRDLRIDQREDDYID